MPYDFASRNPIPLLTSLLGRESSPTLPTTPQVSLRELEQARQMAYQNQDQARIQNILTLMRARERAPSIDMAAPITSASADEKRPTPGMGPFKDFNQLIEGLLGPNPETTPR